MILVLNSGPHYEFRKEPPRSQLLKTQLLWVSFPLLIIVHTLRLNRLEPPNWKLVYAESDVFCRPLVICNFVYNIVAAWIQIGLLSGGLGSMC